MLLKHLSRCCVVAVFTLLAAGCETIPAQDPDTVIFLVRHAEKLTGDDPSLSEEGKIRAVLLADRLKRENIQYIHSTDYARTRQTAAPLAEILELDVQSYDPRDLPGFARILRGQKGRHLVVGHSNTTPALVEALGGMPATAIYEPSEYDRLYIVTLGADGGIDSELERYGSLYQPE